MLFDVFRCIISNECVQTKCVCTLFDYKNSKQQNTGYGIKLIIILLLCDMQISNVLEAAWILRVLCTQKNKYCFPFLQSFVCLNGNKRHSCGSKTALSPERRERVVPSHTLCIVHAAKCNQAALEITLWPLCIDQFLDMPCSILFQKVWTVSIVCCISLNSIFKCLHKCVLALF